MARSVDPRPDATWRVRDDDGRAPLVAHAVTDADGAVWVHLDGVVIVEAPPTTVRTRRHAAGAANLEAPMPAQVTAVLVGVGDEVARGDVLILLDAMKMELPLRAPADGRVEAIHCAVGDRVAPGRALIDLASRETST